MPEGDTVHRAARRLHAALAGREVTRFEIRVPGSATADVRGELVHEVAAYGKHLLHRIGDSTLHSHLRMDGEWHTYRPGQRWRKPAFKARAIVGATGAPEPGWETVGFDLAMVEVLPTRDEDRVVGHLGPDPLSDGWDPVEAARRVSADTRAIHVALQDQRSVAGFGNEYASELLFLRGVHPERPATEVDVPALLDLGARTIRRNVDLPVRVFTGDSRRGFERWVYGREHRQCRRCGTPVRRGALGADPTRERVVYWCPRCQPA
ncbi:DNA-formamidopyrimidine glycosylase family protein [Microbacterium marinilacus]|uniref:DNA-(apurinic or apyrimidinic site) lyase n=1 Tax=Microbacterium marinilacus TaxID=415209 RepID=A0ABP7BD07_9MICO|nr:DNA-formamidopyrimidine glycosylase family protein [Microbacterium marinilacus]MBY0690223.1 Fpg/Nei family DNA glycosylase [Microbacterium marinilacus]